MKNPYLNSLQLPKTSFPMKAKLSEKEPQIIKTWEQQGIYKKLLEKNKDAKMFFLEDGPPYANGPIHIGHVRNKILKDIVIKYKNLQGFKAPFLHCWDCHGLPIELKTIQKISDKQDYTAQDLRTLCRKEASSWVSHQKQQFQRLGILGDWDQNLLTMDPEYEAEEVSVFASLVKKGLIYQGKKPVFWCFKLQTALAFSEAEYKDHKSISIYVNFDLNLESQKKLQSSKPVSACIWTTTTWTLPANSAIALHPEHDYGLYQGPKRSLLLACKLADKFFKDCEMEPYPLQTRFKGKDLEGLIYTHPFLNRESPLILASHVTLDSGTGLVHTAPGHGLDDYTVGKKYQLKEYCPVDKRAHFTNELPDNLKGLFIFKAIPVILNMLKESGHLVAQKNLVHSYPYNPRSNSPLIYRLTNQWFLSLDKITDAKTSIRTQAIEACKSHIDFIPSWGQARLLAMIKNSPDWCLSRQRFWGVPIVVFYCNKCHHALLDPSIIQQISQKMLSSRQGIEYYFSTDVKELLAKDTSCKKCASKDFRKGTDILDVWFDSGVGHAVFSKRTDHDWPQPACLFLEGSDQHRGWFQTSLLSSLALKKEAPFRQLLTHGFVNDKSGHKMSKSKGNVLNPESIIQNQGSEILRLWVASENHALDISAGSESFQRLTESYRRFRNTFRFILGNISDFNPSKGLVEFSQLNKIDQWMLMQLNTLIQNTSKSYEAFAIHQVHQQLCHFFTIPCSSLYLDIIKDRLYTFSKTSLERRQAQSVLYHLINKLLPLMAPITSFLSEEAYSHLPQTNHASVFLEDYPKIEITWEKTQVKHLFEKLMPLRESLNKQLEILRTKGDIKSNLQASAKITLKNNFIDEHLTQQEQLEFFGVSQLKITTGDHPAITVQAAEGHKCIRCWFISTKINLDKICPKCVKNLIEK